jgi:hypothetical protein
VATFGLALLALLAACAVALSGLALALKLPLVLVVALLLLRGLRRLLEPWPLLEWDAAGQWWLHDGAGGSNAAPDAAGSVGRERSHRPDPMPVQMFGAARLGPLLVLRLRVEGRRRVLLLTPGMLPAADLRRLRVRLGLG